MNSDKFSELVHQVQNEIGIEGDVESEVICILKKQIIDKVELFTYRISEETAIDALQTRRMTMANLTCLARDRGNKGECEKNYQKWKFYNRLSTVIQRENMDFFIEFRDQLWQTSQNQISSLKKHYE